MVKVAEYIDIYGHHYIVYERPDKVRFISKTTMGETHGSQVRQGFENLRENTRGKASEGNFPRVGS